MTILKTVTTEFCKSLVFSLLLRFVSFHRTAIEYCVSCFYASFWFLL